MSESEKASRLGSMNIGWQRFIIQGTIIMFVGALLALASVANPDAVILSARYFSWLPVSGMFIVLLGIMGCLEALFAKEQRELLQNLQVGVLDVVVGTLTVLSISGTISRLSIMIAAFLIVRGIVRIAFVYALNLPYKLSTVIGGVVSLILGILIFMEWPTTEGWFISLCLNIEIAFRGWAIISFGLWVKKQKTNPDS
jgi:uncharacterized membrane protein HdeD (DUF308 family)